MLAKRVLMSFQVVMLTLPRAEGIPAEKWSLPDFSISFKVRGRQSGQLLLNRPLWLTSTSMIKMICPDQKFYKKKSKSFTSP